MIGVDLAVEMLACGDARAVADELVDGPFASAEAVQAMQPGQFDSGRPCSRRRATSSACRTGASDRSHAHEIGIDRLRLEIARQRGSMVGARRARDRLRAAAGGSRSTTAAGCMPKTGPRSPTATARRSGPGTASGSSAMDRRWSPRRITVEAIDAEQNTEVRRVMIERFGAERLIREGGAELVNEDEAGRLWRRELPAAGGRATSRS